MNRVRILQAADVELLRDLFAIGYNPSVLARWMNSHRDLEQDKEITQAQVRSLCLYATY